MKTCWYKCFASGCLQVLTDCTVYKHHFEQKKKEKKTVVLQLFWIRRTGCIYNCSIDNWKYYICFSWIWIWHCSFNMKDLGILDSKPHISLWIYNLLRIFSRVFSPYLMCRTLYLGLSSALSYIWANILFSLSLSFLITSHGIWETRAPCNGSTES